MASIVSSHAHSSVAVTAASAAVFQHIDRNDTPHRPSVLPPSVFTLPVAFFERSLPPAATRHGVNYIVSHGPASNFIRRLHKNDQLAGQSDQHAVQEGRRVVRCDVIQCDAADKQGRKDSKRGGTVNGQDGKAPATKRRGINQSPMGLTHALVRHLRKNDRWAGRCGRRGVLEQ